MTYISKTTSADRDWAEDFEHENGRYLCLCCECDRPFVGHKRRVVCKKCSEQHVVAQSNQPGYSVGVG